MAENPLVGIPQNPAPYPERGQGALDLRLRLVDQILAQFYKVLPSNYVSTQPGSYYTLQFQTWAEQIADIQLAAQEAFKDLSYDYTRPEFLWDLVGGLVFPAGTGVPRLEGDITYREFVQSMVRVLLKGATAPAVTEGANLLTDLEVTLVERYLGAREAGSAWTTRDQFLFDVEVHGIPLDPNQLESNTRLVLDLLKPAHTLYTYRYVLEEVFGTLFTDAVTWDLDDYFYDDARKFNQGVAAITGTEGRALSRYIFSDPTRDFGPVQPGGWLQVTDGVNVGRYQVRSLVAFPGGDDSTPRAYTTSPSSLTGTLTVVGATVTDLSQDWSLAVEGEQLTLASGPNAGVYRLAVVLGENGGPCGEAFGPGTQARIAYSGLRLASRLADGSVSDMEYKVDVDRLGVKAPLAATNDVSDQFWE